MAQRILLAHLIVSICLLSLVGCAFRQEYDVSIPTLANGKDINYSRIDYPEFSLHVRLLNDIKTYDVTIFIVVPYIQTEAKSELSYKRKGQPYDATKEFRVLLSVLPRIHGYSIDSEKIYLIVDDVEISVAKTEGPIQYFPYKNIGFPKDWGIAQLKKEVNEGYIFSIHKEECVIKEIGKDNPITELCQIDLWNCFELIFNCPTPSPKQNIKLKFEGLSTAGNTINIPIIKFKESRFIDRGSIP